MPYIGTAIKMGEVSGPNHVKSYATKEEFQTAIDAGRVELGEQGYIIDEAKFYYNEGNTVVEVGGGAPLVATWEDLPKTPADGDKAIIGSVVYEFWAASASGPDNWVRAEWRGSTPHLYESLRGDVLPAGWDTYAEANGGAISVATDGDGISRVAFDGRGALNQTAYAIRDIAGQPRAVRAYMQLHQRLDVVSTGTSSINGVYGFYFSPPIRRQGVDEVRLVTPSFYRWASPPSTWQRFLLGGLNAADAPTEWTPPVSHTVERFVELEILADHNLARVYLDHSPTPAFFTDLTSLDLYSSYQRVLLGDAASGWEELVEVRNMVAWAGVTV